MCSCGPVGEPLTIVHVIGNFVSRVESKQIAKSDSSNGGWQIFGLRPPFLLMTGAAAKNVKLGIERLADTVHVTLPLSLTTKHLYHVYVHCHTKLCQNFPISCGSVSLDTVHSYILYDHCALAERITLIPQLTD